MDISEDKRKWLCLVGYRYTMGTDSWIKPDPYGRTFVLSGEFVRSKPLSAMKSQNAESIAAQPLR